MFEASKCDFCGDCLVKCQYVAYSEEDAMETMKALVNGQDADILGECITCMACNDYCEKGANPFDLINSLQEERHSLAVPPPTLEMFEHLAEAPSKVTRGELGKSAAVSFCTISPFISPDILDHPMFKGMTVIKGGDYFCHYAMPHVLKGSVMEEKGRAFMDHLIGLNVDEIIFVHEECHAMVLKMEKEFGIKAPFKATSILEHMITHIKENHGKIQPLNKRIAYQRPCSSWGNPHTEGMLTEFFDLVGVERIDRVYDGENALCCGAAVMGLGQVDRGKEIMSRNMHDIMSHGAEALVYLCPFCGYSLAEPCKMAHLPSAFVIDLLRMALGELPFPDP